MRLSVELWPACGPYLRFRDSVVPQDAVAVPEHAWREALDPITKQIYYFNQDTKETQWMRPEIMGPAPSGTGW